VCEKKLWYHTPENTRPSREPPRSVTQSGAPAAQRRGAAVAIHRDNSADHRGRADGGVAPRFGVTSTKKLALGASRGHGDEPMREQSPIMATEQHITADNVVARDRCNRDHFTVADRGVHARALGAETDNRSGGERFFNQRMKEPSIAHTRLPFYP
jgi:hypothetical protein